MRPEGTGERGEHQQPVERARGRSVLRPRILEGARAAVRWAGSAAATSAGVLGSGTLSAPRSPVDGGSPGAFKDCTCS